MDYVDRVGGFADAKEAWPGLGGKGWRWRGVNGQVMATAINPGVGKDVFQGTPIGRTPVIGGPLVAAFAAAEIAIAGDADIAAHGLHLGSQARVQRGDEVGDDEFHGW